MLIHKQRNVSVWQKESQGKCLNCAYGFAKSFCSPKRTENVLYQAEWDDVRHLLPETKTIKTDSWNVILRILSNVSRGRKKNFYSFAFSLFSFSPSHFVLIFSFLRGNFDSVASVHEDSKMKENKMVPKASVTFSTCNFIVFRVRRAAFPFPVAKFSLFLSLSLPLSLFLYWFSVCFLSSAFGINCPLCQSGCLLNPRLALRVGLLFSLQLPHWSSLLLFHFSRR